jgi:hypothetical protein
VAPSRRALDGGPLEGFDEFTTVPMPCAFYRAPRCRRSIARYVQMQRITAEMPPTRSSSATDGWQDGAVSAGAPPELFVRQSNEGQWPSFLASWSVAHLGAHSTREAAA